MIFLTYISFIQIRHTIFENSETPLINNTLICDNLQIHFGQNVSFLCENKFKYSTRYDKLVSFKINVSNSVNFINHSFNYNEISYSYVKSPIKTGANIKLIFTDFLDVQIIQNFIYLYLSTYDDVILTMDWNKYITTDSNNCQWYQSNILPSYKGIISQFEKIGESSVWEKVCVNNQACFHYVKDNPGETIIISDKATIIIISSICGFILFIIILLYLIARCQIYNTNETTSSDSSEISISSSSESINFNSEFFKELLGIGNSAGSLIMEGISLLKSFQRMSATKTFTIHFSKKCYKMISWAKNIFENIITNFYIRPFNNIELFYCYNYVFPTIIITFITLLVLSNKYYYLLILNSIFAAFGFGFGYIQTNLKIALYFIIISFIVGLVVLIIYFKCCHFVDKFFILVHSERSVFPLTFSVILTLIIASIILLPFFIKNLYFIGSSLLICLIVIILVFIIELIIGCINHFYRMSDFFMFRLPLLCTNILTLLYIPAIDYFVNIKKKNWTSMVGYINFGVLIPLGLTILLFGGTDFLFKYRKKSLMFFEILDVFRQISYAFVSAYDIPYACIGIECFWFILLIIFRPFNDKSEYVIQIGNSLILIISNVVVVAYDVLKKGFLSFYFSLFIIAAACIPAIISLFVFFRYDFEINNEEALIAFKENKKKNGSIIIGLLITFYNPFSWMFFGMYIPVIMNYFNDYYNHYHIM